MFTQCNSKRQYLLYKRLRGCIYSIYIKQTQLNIPCLTLSFDKNIYKTLIFFSEARLSRFVSYIGKNTLVCGSKKINVPKIYYKCIHFHSGQTKYKHLKKCIDFHSCQSIYKHSKKCINFHSSQTIYKHLKMCIHFHSGQTK